MINNPVRSYDAQPEDHGMVAWSYEPNQAGTGLILQAAGTLNTVRIKLPKPTTVTSIMMLTSVAGSSLTAGQCFAMIFDETGARVGVTADMATLWAATAGQKDMVLTAPANLNGPFCTVGLYANGTTLPTFRLSVGSTVAGNINIATGSSRFGVANTGLTTTPPSTLGTITAQGFPWWVGLR